MGRVGAHVGCMSGAGRCRGSRAGGGGGQGPVVAAPAREGEAVVGWRGCWTVGVWLEARLKTWGQRGEGESAGVLTPCVLMCVATAG